MGGWLRSIWGVMACLIKGHGKRLSSIRCVAFLCKCNCKYGGVLVRVIMEVWSQVSTFGLVLREGVRANRRAIRVHVVANTYELVGCTIANAGTPRQRGEWCNFEYFLTDFRELWKYQEYRKHFDIPCESSESSGNIRNADFFFIFHARVPRAPNTSRALDIRDFLRELSVHSEAWAKTARRYGTLDAFRSFGESCESFRAHWERHRS